MPGVFARPMGDVDLSVDPWKPKSRGEIKKEMQEDFSMFLQDSITMDILDGLFSWNHDTWQKSVSILSVKRDLLTQKRCTVFTWNSLRKMESPASSKRGLAAHWWPSMSSYATRFAGWERIGWDGADFEEKGKGNWRNDTHLVGRVVHIGSWTVGLDTQNCLFSNEWLLPQHLYCNMYVGSTWNSSAGYVYIYIYVYIIQVYMKIWNRLK